VLHQLAAIKMLSRLASVRGKLDDQDRVFAVRPTTSGIAHLKQDAIFEPAQIRPVNVPGYQSAIASSPQRGSQLSYSAGQARKSLQDSHTQRLPALRFLVYPATDPSTRLETRGTAHRTFQLCDGSPVLTPGRGDT